MSRADSERGTDKFSNCVLEWDEAVEDIQGGLGLVDAAAPHRRKKVNDENRYQQAHRRGCSNDAQGTGMGQRSQECNPAPIDGDAETDNRKPREDSDENGEDEEESVFIEIGAQAETREMPGNGVAGRHYSRRRNLVRNRGRCVAH